jgi:SAM-dependent methyltransferase
MQEMMELMGQVNTIANAYKRSQILFTALDGNVFALLEQPATAAFVAENTGWNPRGTAMLLDGLVALQLVTKENGAYRNGPAASACLVPGGPAWQGDILRHTQASWPAWAELSKCVATGNCSDIREHELSGTALRNFILGMDNVASFAAPEVLRAVDLSRHTSMLDLAGGPATYSAAFLRAYPQMRATLFDRAAVIALAREKVAAADLQDRFSYIAGDCLTDPLGGPYDLVFMSNIIHSWSPEQNEAVVRKAYDALAPGGSIMIKDFLVDNDRSGPPFSLVFSLHMLVHTPGGGTYTFEEVEAWTNRAGFLPGRAVSITQQTRLWIADKSTQPGGPCHAD